MLSSTEKRSGGTLDREGERLGWRGREGTGSASGSGSRVLRLPEREEDFLKGFFERVIGI
jgi:hypothetical protein